VGEPVRAPEEAVRLPVTFVTDAGPVAGTESLIDFLVR
jgi:hypothetical protein